MSREITSALPLLEVMVVPQTAILGAILWTGYLGGATAVQLRSGAGWFPLVFPSLIGLLLWGGLSLRDERLRALIPVRRNLRAAGSNYRS